MSEVDSSKNVYLFTHGRMDLKEKAVTALEGKGFSKDNILDAIPTKVGDYFIRTISILTTGLPHS